MSRLALSTVPRSIFWIIGALVLLILIGMARVFLNSGPDETASQPPLVSVLEVRPATVAEIVTFTGAIAARDEAAINAEGEGGRVASVMVESGDYVRQGQLLATLDTSTIAPLVASLEASLQEATANAAVARADARRAQAVAEIGALSAQEIERREAAAVAAEARVKIVNAQLSEARARLRRSDIRAPFDALVLTRSAEVGQMAGPGGTPLFRLGRRGSVEMRGNVAERDLPRLVIGQAATVNVTGVAQGFAGKLRLISAVIDPATRMGAVRIELAEHRDLRPGAFARAEVQVGSGVMPVVPQTAVMSDAAGNFVYLVGPNDSVERRDIRVGGSRVEGLVVAAGLEGGERLITTAGPYLRVGEQVRVAP